MPAQQRLPDQVGPSMPSMSESLHVQRIDLNIFDCGYIQSRSRGLNSKICLRILEQVGFANKSEIMLPLFSFAMYIFFLKSSLLLKFFSKFLGTFSS